MRKQFSYSEIMDYLYCPMYYKYIHVDKITSPVLTMNMDFKNALENMMFKMLSKMLDREGVEMEYLKAEFAQSWVMLDIPNGVKYYKMHRTKTREGISTMVKMFNAAKNSDLIPLLINEPYKVHVGEYDIMNNFDCIRQIRSNGQNIIDIIVCKVISSASMAIPNKDLEVLLDSYAFRTIFGKQEERLLMLVLNDYDKNRYVRLKDEDYQNLIDAVNAVCGAINRKEFYLCPSKSCSPCPFAKMCKK